MVTIIAIMIAILVLDHFINRKLIAKLNIKEFDLGKKYVNRLHKYGEGILHWASLIVMIIAISDFKHLRIFIFIGMTMLFAFRTIMKWIYAKENKTYLLSATTCILFILGSVIYEVTTYVNIV